MRILRLPVLLAAACLCLLAAQEPWQIHDPGRPMAPVVAPGPAGPPVPPPADAVVLFDGKDLSKWTDAKGQPAR